MLFAATVVRAAAFLAFTACAASVAAQQPPPAPPGTTGPVQPPATQNPQQPPTPADPAQGQPAPAPKDAAQPVQPPSLGRVIAADAGVIFFPVKPERTADFEKVMAKLHEALAAAEDPVRKQQAAGWKVFKAVEPGPNNTVLYVFLIDPAVKGTDYAFWKTMYEAFPDDVQELYRLYIAASASGQALLNLQLLQSFGAPPQTAPQVPAPKVPPAKIPD